MVLTRGRRNRRWFLPEGRNTNGQPHELELHSFQSIVLEQNAHGGSPGLKITRLVYRRFGC